MAQGYRMERSTERIDTPRTLAALAPRKDVNLPDDDAGKEVGRLLPGERSKDPVKQRYRDKIRTRNKGRDAIGFYRNRPAADRDADTQQEDQSDIVFGGDADDPRWKQYFAERKTLGAMVPKKKGAK